MNLEISAGLSVLGLALSNLVSHGSLSVESIRCIVCGGGTVWRGEAVYPRIAGRDVFEEWKVEAIIWTWRAGGVIGEDSDSELESRCVRVCARLEKGEETGPSESEVEGSECVTPVGVMMPGSEVEGSKCVMPVGEVLLG